jgi:hypothetical protein
MTKRHYSAADPVSLAPDKRWKAAKDVTTYSDVEVSLSGKKALKHRLQALFFKVLG